ncbi:hypothetical protein D5F01_LYC23501 [Larimichthys crocea]|uniref:Uncharacterized protein n=1 Tax=Larimichthys crocea TaxID=215358 RepID=A0A6G0HH75_LARCR|nr:hypothetical protein D5F01_LYC23501 [Larimichthys crocea]
MFTLFTLLTPDPSALNCSHVTCNNIRHRCFGQEAPLAQQVQTHPGPGGTTVGGFQDRNAPSDPAIPRRSPSPGSASPHPPGVVVVVVRDPPSSSGGPLESTMFLKPLSHAQMRGRLAWALALASLCPHICTRLRPTHPHTLQTEPARAATPYNWSRYAISSVLGRDQMEALARQLEEMKSQLQRAEENGSFQESKVERLNKKLGQEKELKKQLLCQVEEMKEKYDMDINTEKQRIVTLVEKLEMMEKEIARKMSELDHLIYEHQKTEHDTNLLKEQVSERDMELEHLKILLHEQTSKNNQVVVQLQTEKDLNGILHAELETLKDQRTFNFSVSQNPEPVDQGSSCDSQNPELVDERSSCDSQNPEPVDKDPLSVSQDTENAVVTTRKPSLWKKTCHFLCLRKKNMQRNVHQHAEFPRVSQDLEPLQESSFSVSQDSVVESGCVTHSPEPVVEDSSPLLRTQI